MTRASGRSGQSDISLYGQTVTLSCETIVALLSPLSSLTTIRPLTARAQGKNILPALTFPRTASNICVDNGDTSDSPVVLLWIVLRNVISNNNPNYN